MRISLKTSESMSRGSIKIAVDENLSAVGKLLKEKGFNCIQPDSKMSDNNICIWLRENNVKVFITRNFDDFKHCKFVGLFHDIQAKWCDEVVAHHIEQLMIKYYHKQKQGVVHVNDDSYKMFTK